MDAAYSLCGGREEGGGGGGEEGEIKRGEEYQGEEGGRREEVRERVGTRAIAAGYEVDGAMAHHAGTQ